MKGEVECFYERFVYVGEDPLGASKIYRVVFYAQLVLKVKGSFLFLKFFLQFCL